MVVLITIVIFAIFLIYMAVKSYIIDDDTISLFTGSNGSGKTYFAIKRCFHNLRKLHIKVFFHNLFEFLKFWKKDKDFWEKPRFFSSIPVKYGLFKRRFSEPLKVEHLTMKERLPFRCVVFIDEVNLLCSQMQYKLQCENELNTFVTLFRHLGRGSYLCVVTQNYNKVHWIFRYCVGYVHNLSGCHKIPFVCIWTKCKKVDTGDDVRNLSIDGEENVKYLFSFFSPFKSYDTYCFDNVNNYQSIGLTNYDEYASFKINTWKKLK